VPFPRPKSTVAQATLPVLAGLVFFALLGMAAWGIAAWTSHNASPGKVQVNLGEDTFNMGPAKERAQEVAERGPLLFPGLVAADEGYIVVNHAGVDDFTGWKAFAAVPPGSRIECAVQWRPDARRFQDPCTGAAYPADGAGLTAYRVLVNPDRELVIDLGRGSGTTAPA
jgi:hypothetical protein